MTISTFGDFFPAASENVTVSADGGAFNFGVFLNNNTADDIFNHPTDIASNQYFGGPPDTASAVIPIANLNALLADGQIDFLLDYSSDVNLDQVPGSGPGLIVSLQLQYETGTVPEPSSLIVWSLIGLTFASIGWWRRKA